MNNIDEEFEEWFTVEMPWMLNLSPSKQVASQLLFDGIHDFVRLIAKHQPEELKDLVKELDRRGRLISKWRAPKGHYVGLNWNNNGVRLNKTYPNGKPHYILKMTTPK